MDKRILRELVENYKKMQIYSIDEYTAEESIIFDIEQDLNGYYKENLILKKRGILVKIIAYMEFGFIYENNQTLLDQALKLCSVNKDMLLSFVDGNAQYIGLKKIELSRVIVWKMDSRKKSLRKGDVIEKILELVQIGQTGAYFFETQRSKYKLIIDKQEVKLENVKKRITYFLVNK